VLHLDPGVHLEEEVLPVPREEALDRAGGAVAHRAGGIDGDLPDARSESVVDRRGGGLLDDLLVSPLDRAVALAEVDHVVVSVRQHLHLDVPGVLEVALDVHDRVGEVRLSLPPS
jgi:hypothetical protein